MNLVTKISICLAFIFTATQSSFAQCVPTTNLLGNTTVCEGSRTAYAIDYALGNGGNVTLSATGGRVLFSRTVVMNPKEARTVILVLWDNTAGTANGIGQIQINKTASGCTSTDTVPVTVLDSSNGNCQ